MTGSLSDVQVDHLRCWIGREESVSDVVSIDLVHKFNATLDIEGDMPKLGDAAPLLVNYCLAQPAPFSRSLGEDGHPQRGGFYPPVPLPRRMWAGSSITFHRDLHVGDEVRRASRISDVVVKHGRSGVLCFVTVEHRIEVGGALAIEERQDIVYREGVSGSAPAASTDAASVGTHTKPMLSSTAVLFRYSALTFNGHRIHYDRRYATEVECNPGLVVHGPLQATQLLHYAVELKGQAPKRFSFRSVSPVFDDDQIHLHASDLGDKMQLWTARDTGPVATSAEVSWS